MSDKYIVLTGSSGGYFVIMDYILNAEELLDIFPNMRREFFTELTTEEARLVPRETFIQEKDLWHRVMDTVWYPEWEEWKEKVQKWFLDKQLNFYRTPVEGTAMQVYVCEFENEGWFINLTKGELKDIQDKYRTEVYLSDKYKQNSDFLMVLVIKR